MSSVPLLSSLVALATSSDGAHEGGRAASSGGSSGSSRGSGPSLTLGPVLGVTATISAKGLQALASDAVDAVETVADVVTGTVGDVAGGVGNVLGNVVGYGVMAALGGGAVLDELA
ncbi:hypothetical protein ACQ86G_03260 [Roseateles chitinivorans]|uniref:hypothetical protein n=1 Tax=Roseateles chitinivorans TaxID=2917965 RepID=UPI003D674894